MQSSSPSNDEFLSALRTSGADDAKSWLFELMVRASEEGARRALAQQVESLEPLGAILGLLTERLFLRPLIGEPTLTVIMVTVGLSFFFRGIAELFFGTDTLVFNPPVFPSEPLRLGAVGAEELRHLDAVNVGAAGTFVVRKPVTQARLRTEVARRLSFDTEIVICPGQDIVELVSQDFFTGHPARPDIVRFVSVLSRRPRFMPRLPMMLPARGKWLLKVLARDDRFVAGLYRRDMRVIRYLGMLDRAFGVPLTSRSWNTITAVARILDNGATS